MAAYVFRNDLIRVFKQAIDLFEKESGLSRDKKKTEFYQKMTRAINNRNQGNKISDRFLQKKIASEVTKNFNAIEISVDLQHLNALYAYSQNKVTGKYEDEYLVGKSKNDLANAGVKKIAKIEYLDKRKNHLIADFPIENSNYPSSPLIPFPYKEFKRIWIKDESYNSTGTFKDRWSWVIVKYYRKKIAEFGKSHPEEPLPRLCMISTGAAAIALQYLLAKFKLPSLKVIIHNKGKTLTSQIHSVLVKLGCEPITYSFDEKDFSKEKIREKLGMSKYDVDVTFTTDDAALLNLQFEYYKWLAIEILDQNPDYCFVPMGSGMLFQNILETAKREVLLKGKGNCFFAESDKIKNCVFLGATADHKNSLTILDKLYAKYFPIIDLNLNHYRETFCNIKSDVFILEESFVRDAMNLIGIGKYTRRFTNVLEITDHMILAEASGLAGLALFLQMENTIPKDAKIIIVNTGRLSIEKLLHTEIDSKTPY